MNIFIKIASITLALGGPVTADDLSSRSGDMTSEGATPNEIDYRSMYENAIKEEPEQAIKKYPLLSTGNPKDNKYIYMWQCYVLGKGNEMNLTQGKINVVPRQVGPHFKNNDDSYDFTQPETGLLKIPENYTGVWRYWAKSGKLISKSNIKDGKIHGIQRSYFSNGALKQFAYAKNGKYRGLTVIFSESGQPSFIEDGKLTIIYSKFFKIDQRKKYAHLLKDHPELLKKKKQRGQ